ncbi:UNVERIFIED_CONTAM: hypothetical protein K2H54_061921 [Gekko kuhli]
MPSRGNCRHSREQSPWYNWGYHPQGAIQWHPLGPFQGSNLNSNWSLDKPLMADPRDLGPCQGHRPTELLDAMFNGTPKKVEFFVVRAQKFVMNWGHLFPNDEQQVDYIAFIDYNHWHLRNREE